MDRQTARQPAVSFLAVLKRHPIGPLTAEGLNEPLRLPLVLAVEGLGRMCRSPRMRQALPNALET